jgi:hypothetical protein
MQAELIRCRQFSDDATGEMGQAMASPAMVPARATSSDQNVSMTGSSELLQRLAAEGVLPVRWANLLVRQLVLLF